METTDMAGDWIKMRTALANDPAVIAIALDLDKSEFEVVGMLHHLWSWADSQSQDGHIKRVTEKWIDRYVHHSGFARSMCDAGWLRIETDGITFPNFDRHNGESAKKRAEAAERQRISRANKAAGNVTDPSQESCDKSVTREEKRREDQEHKSPPTPKPKKSKPEIDPTWFDIFWKLYPNKVAKPKARASFEKQCPDESAFQRIMTGLKQHVLSELFVKDGGRFQPHPTTWLNQERYNDEVKPYVQSANGSGSGASRPSLVDQVRQHNADREAQRQREARYGTSADAQLSPAGLEKGGFDWDGEFSRINEADGSLVGADD